MVDKVAPKRYKMLSKRGVKIEVIIPKYRWSGIDMIRLDSECVV